MSSGLASSSSAASRLACSTTSSDALPAATPPIWVDFEPYVPVPRATASVSPLTTVDLLDRQAEPIGDDLRERGLVTLALGERSGADDRLARRR